MRLSYVTIAGTVSSLRGVFLSHTEGHLLAELVHSGSWEEQGLVFTGTHCLEVGYITPHQRVQSVREGREEKEERKGGRIKRRREWRREEKCTSNLSYLRLNLFTQPCDSSLTSENTMERLLNCTKVKGHDEVRFDSAERSEEVGTLRAQSA